MRKRLIAVPLLCGALLSLAACGNYAIPDSTPPPSQAVAANPFEAAEEEAGFLAMLTHEAASSDFSESGERLPFVYDGGKFQLAYQYSVTGKLGGVSMDTLDDGIYYTLSYDGGIVHDNLRVSAPVTLQYTMCGTAGASYSIAFFLDHQPVKIGESTSCSITLSKGGVMEIEAVIDPDKLGEFNTFYCVAVPRNGTSAPFFKSNSILLYKEN